jgi:hypothetical protein
MSTTDSASKNVLPPGIPLNSNPNIGNVTITKIVNPQTTIQTEITFPISNATIPLQPLTQAFYTPKNQYQLAVSSIVFLPDNADGDDIIVYYDDNQLKPRFYLAYDAPEVDSKTFYAWSVDFNITLSNKPRVIKTYLWDIDPETSRGTETTVQP